MKMLQPEAVFSATIVLLVLELIYIFYLHMHAEQVLRQKHSKTFLQKVRRAAREENAVKSVFWQIFLTDSRKELPRAWRWMIVVLPVQTAAHLLAAAIAVGLYFAGLFSTVPALFLWVFAIPSAVEGGFIFVWWIKNLILHGKDGTGWHK